MAISKGSYFEKVTQFKEQYENLDLDKYKIDFIDPYNE